MQEPWGPSPCPHDAHPVAGATQGLQPPSQPCPWPFGGPHTPFPSLLVSPAPTGLHDSHKALKPRAGYRPSVLSASQQCAVNGEDACLRAASYLTVLSAHAQASERPGGAGVDSGCGQVRGPSPRVWTGSGSPPMGVDRVRGPCLRVWTGSGVPTHWCGQGQRSSPRVWTGSGVHACGYGQGQGFPAPPPTALVTSVNLGTSLRPLQVPAQLAAPPYWGSLLGKKKGKSLTNRCRHHR